MVPETLAKMWSGQEQILDLKAEITRLEDVAVGMLPKPIHKALLLELRCRRRGSGGLCPLCG